MLADTLRFLIQTASDLFVLVLLLRFYLQVANAPVRHPLVQFVKSATDFIVLPLRRRIPAWRGYDTATLLTAWLTSLLSIVLLLVLAPLPYNFSLPSNWLSVGLLAVLYVFRATVYLLMGAVIVQAVLSWVSPYNPLAPLLELLTRPFLRPFRRLVIGQVDLSPLVLLIVLQVVLMLPIAFLEQTLLAQLQFGV